jgi:choline dehydrogenase
MFDRGQPVDYDTWAQMGCPGWSYADVLPYFKKLETTELGSDEFRGRAGPIRVTQARKLSPFYDLLIKSAGALGIAYNPDYNDAVQEGVSMTQMSVHRGFRQSTATQYLKPALRRPNFKLLRAAEATSLILEGKRCVGVRYWQGGQIVEARAAREVIVCCGAANTPKLLELSGIGIPAVLERHGIKAVHALHGVGENLRDHYGLRLSWRLNRPGISLARKGRGWRLGLEVLRYLFLRTGFIAHSMGTIRVVTRSRPDAPNPDILMYGAPYIIEVQNGNTRRMSATEGFYILPHVQRTESTGSVHIRSADPFDPPLINFSFLETQADRALAICAVRKAREIVLAAPLADAVAEELEPGPRVTSDDEILQALRSRGLITHHISGTCRMGSDPMAVVDERLRVHGIEGLRIADASIMPTIPSGNINAPCIMIGEKCADMVLADAGHR